MTNINGDTKMGGVKQEFATTCWTEILDSRTSDKAREKLIINDLLERYWKPVYCYLRCKGYSNEVAKDLTQGFFHDIVLGRELIQQADQTKGRFRKFLLTALDRYVIDMHRLETAKKRRPAGKLLRLDGELPIAISDVTPDQGFHYAWVSVLLDKILNEVKDECYDTNKKIHWEVFFARCLNPIMNNIKPLPLKEICAKYDIDNDIKASNMIITVKRRLRKALERHLQQFVKSNKEIDKELYELLKVFTKKGAE